MTEKLKIIPACKLRSQLRTIWRQGRSRKIAVTYYSQIVGVFLPLEELATLNLPSLQVEEATIVQFRDRMTEILEWTTCSAVRLSYHSRPQCAIVRPDLLSEFQEGLYSIAYFRANSQCDRIA